MERFIRRILVSVEFFEEAGGGGRIAPFAAGGLKGVEAETEVRSVDALADVPDVGPGWGVGGPAPVFVGEAEVFRREVVGELLEVFDDGVAGGCYLGGRGVGGSDLYGSGSAECFMLLPLFPSGQRKRREHQKLSGSYVIR